MTSNIRLYRNTGLKPDKNFVFENHTYFKAWLAYFSHTDLEVQFQKFEQNLTLTITIEQTNYIATSEDAQVATFDYVHFRYTPPTPAQGSAPSPVDVFYFVTATTWKAQKVATLSLTLDVLNTFSPRYLGEFTRKTLTTRKHKDRFSNYHQGEGDPFYTLTYKIDKFPEGINPTLYLKDKEELLPPGMLSSQRYYLIYSASDDLEVDNITNPVRVFLSAKERKVLKSGVNNPVRTYTDEDFDRSNEYYLIPSENDNQISIRAYYGNVVGATFTYDPSSGQLFWAFSIGTGDYGGIEIIIKAFTNTGWTVVGMYEAVAGNDLKLDFQPVTKMHVSTERNYTQIDVIASLPQIICNSGVVADIAIEPFSQTIDRTSSKLMKIIELPYAPTDLTFASVDNIGSNIWKWDNGLLILKDLNTEFVNNQFILKNLWKYARVQQYGDPVELSTARMNFEDPKLQSSQFSAHIINYDSFSKDISFDDAFFDWNENPSVLISFKMNNTLAASFAFKYEINGASHWAELEKENFNNYLIASRNNEVPIFSSGYVDYIRSGYNYDVKSKNTAQTQQFAGLLAAGATTALTVAAASNPYLAAAVGVASMVVGITNFVISERQAQDAIDRKLKELSQQSIGVAGSTDVQVMDYYNDNKLWFFYYEPSDGVKEALSNLFFYYGYACNDFGVPDIHSRMWFDFIQCTPVFSKNAKIYISDYLAEIEERFKAGVTIFHPHTVTGASIYDYEQIMENWEDGIYNQAHPSA